MSKILLNGSSLSNERGLDFFCLSSEALHHLSFSNRKNCLLRVISVSALMHSTCLCSAVSHVCAHALSHASLLLPAVQAAVV